MTGLSQFFFPLSSGEELLGPWLLGIRVRVTALMPFEHLDATAAAPTPSTLSAHPLQMRI